MTDRPVTTDPLSALTRADGSTEAHSKDHGRVIGIWENVQHHGAKGDGVSDDTAAFQLAIDAGTKVYVPRPAVNYVISDKLTVSSAKGLHMVGEMTPGTQNRILCNNFPATTDVFEMTHTSNPRLRLEDLFFDNDSGTAPRDFFRLTVTDNHGIDWRNVVISNMDGWGFNAPAGKQLVTGLFDKVQVTDGGAGGMNIDSCTATTLRGVRFVANGGSADLVVGATAAASSGLTLESIVLDGYTPPGAFDRLKLSYVSGLSIINPYFEWTNAGTAGGTLRDILLTNCNYVSLIGGTGSVTPTLGAFTLTALDLQSCTNVVIMELPIGTLAGASTTSLNIANCSGVIAYVSDTASRIAVDSTSAAGTTIYNGGTLLRSRNAITTAGGATPDSQGARALVLVNAGATNMTNLQGGANGSLITLMANDGNTTLKQTAGGDGQFFLRGGVDYNLPANFIITLMYFGGYWRETGR